METMTTWWAGLTTINQWFYVAAAFFSVFFLWQLIMAIVGITGGEADVVDTHVDLPASHDAPHDATDTAVVFKLLSFRSIIAFFTLSTWAAALYLNQNIPMDRSLIYATIWGVVAMVLVSLIFFLMRKMTETGNININTAVGTTGTVYLDIPAGGYGEMRALCDGVMTHFKACIAGGAGAKAGTSVKILKVTGPNMVEVEIAH